MNRARGDTGFFQSRRKLKNGLFLIVLSGCLLMSGTVCEQVRIDRKRQEQTKLQYGQWEALVPDPDRDTRALLESHALLKSIGEQTVYGTFVMNPEDNARINGRSRPEETRNSYKKGMMRREETEFLIGWGNREFLEMEGLQLQSGRWPQSAEEAVVEEQVAYSLGMQAYPEQQLTGTLNDKPYTFRITGILRNSTESWTEGDRLASIFTGGRLEAASAETFLFLQGSKPGVIPDLRKAVPALIMNERSQYSWNPVSFADVPYTLLFAVSFLGEILAAVLFFLAVAGKARRRDWCDAAAGNFPGDSAEGFPPDVFQNSRISFRNCSYPFPAAPASRRAVAVLCRRLCCGCRDHSGNMCRDDLPGKACIEPGRKTGTAASSKTVCKGSVGRISGQPFSERSLRSHPAVSGHSFHTGRDSSVPVSFFCGNTGHFRAAGTLL